MAYDTSTGRERRFQIPRLALVAIDMAAWAIGVMAAMALRFDLRTSAWEAWRPEFLIVVGAVVLGIGGRVAVPVEEHHEAGFASARDIKGEDARPGIPFECGASVHPRPACGCAETSH